MRWRYGVLPPHVWEAIGSLKTASLVFCVCVVHCCNQFTANLGEKATEEQRLARAVNVRLAPIGELEAVGECLFCFVKALQVVLPVEVKQRLGWVGLVST